MSELTVVEICAGAGGQSLGLEKAGFVHKAAVELDRHACETLRLNRPTWHVVEADVRALDGREFDGVDLLAGGVPCPPFSVAGRQLGVNDDRDLFPEALRLVGEMRPRGVLLENVRGLATDRFAAYRQWVIDRLASLGYTSYWKLLHANDFGVPQLRPRFVLVALQAQYAPYFRWPVAAADDTPTVGDALLPQMAACGWRGAPAWAARANDIAPTIVGGSKKHGGADLGPTRAKRAWAQLGVDGLGIADAVPGIRTPDDHHPKLTLGMVARLQGWLPEDRWIFAGGKTAAYRQIGNAFPPPVADSVGRSVANALAQVVPETTDESPQPTALVEVVYRVLAENRGRPLSLKEIAELSSAPDVMWVKRRLETLRQDFDIRLTTGKPRRYELIEIKQAAVD